MKGLTYRLGSRLYIALTNRTNAVPLLAQRGLKFRFDLLEKEPGSQDVFQVVDEAYETSEIVGMGENDEGITFAGAGEPLLRLDVIKEAGPMILEKRHGVPLRIKTNGLAPLDFDNNTIADDLYNAGVKKASVFLPTTDPKDFIKLCKPEDDDLNLARVCDFIVELSERGVEVECTTVKQPGVDPSAVRQLAEALGAVQTKVYDWNQ